MRSALLVISAAVNGESGWEETCLAAPTTGLDVTCSVDMADNFLVKIDDSISKCNKVKTRTAGCPFTLITWHYSPALSVHDP